MDSILLRDLDSISCLQVLQDIAKKRINFELKENDEDCIIISAPKGHMSCSKEFLNSITDCSYVIYNKERGICEIIRSEEQDGLDNICKCLNTYLPKETIIWIGMKNPERIKQCSYIFNEPYICNGESLLGYTCDCKIAFAGRNHSKKINTIKRDAKLSYILSEEGKKGNKCGIRFSFNKNITEYFKNLQDQNKNREVSGIFGIENAVLDDNGNPIFILNQYDKTSIVHNNHIDKINISVHRYNYHTHPIGAYEKNGVSNGWPSSTDYSGFWSLRDGIIFHAVISLEGIYIISFGSGYSLEDTIQSQEIKKVYHVDKHKNISPYEYCNIINNQTINGKHVVQVEYIPWDDVSRIFYVIYPKKDGNCFSSEDGINLYRNKNNRK